MDLRGVILDLVQLKCCFHAAKYSIGAPFSLYAGIWYEITSSGAGTALRIVLRMRLRMACTSLGFVAIYSFTDLKSVLAMAIANIRGNEQ